MKAVVVALALALFSRAADACTSFSFAPTLPPTDVAAFEGVVLGYSSASDSILGFTGIPGLVVRVETPLLRSTAGSSVVIYLFGSSSDCSPAPRSLTDLRAQYPAGERVTVVGEAPDGETQAGMATTLVSHADSWGHVSAVPRETTFTPEGVLDFSAFASLHEQQPKHGYSLALAWRNAHRNGYENFQYLRCLVLLSQGPSEARAVAILRNLRFYSGFHGLRTSWAREDYRTVVLNSLLSPSLKKRLLATTLHQ